MSGQDGLKREGGEETALRAACRERFGGDSARDDVAVEELVAFREGTLSAERADALRAASVDDPELAALLVDAQAFPAVPVRDDLHARTHAPEATDQAASDREWDAIRNVLADEGLLTTPAEQDALPAAITEHIARVGAAGETTSPVSFVPGAATETDRERKDAVDRATQAPPAVATPARPATWALAAMVVSALGAGLLFGRLTVPNPAAPTAVLATKLIELNAARTRSSGTVATLVATSADIITFMIEPEPERVPQDGLVNGPLREGTPPPPMTLRVIAVDRPDGDDREFYRNDELRGLAQAGYYRGVIPITMPMPLPPGRYLVRLETRGELVDQHEIVVD